MKLKHGWPAALITLLAFTVLAAGCSSGGASGGDPGNPKVTLRFSWWGGQERHEATLAAINAYKQIAPNVTIEAEYQGFDGYEQKVKTQLASSTSADIMQLDVPWMVELTQNDNFLELSGQDELSLDSFDQNFLDKFGVYNDKLVALPTGVNAYSLVINKTAADQLGVPSDIRWDWDRLYEEGKKLHEQDSSKYLLLTDHGMLMQDFTNMLKQRTGQQWVNDDYTLGFSKEDAVSGLSWIDKAMKAGVYQPLGEAELFYGKTEQNPKWINGDIPIVSAMSSTLLSLRNVLPEGSEVVTALPAVAADAKDTAVLVRPSQLIAISKKTQHPEEALKFVNWLMNDAQAAEILGDVRSVPASSTAQKAAVDAGKIDATVTKAVEDGLANAGIVDNALSTNSELNAVLQDVIEKVAYGREAPESAADELISELNNKLQDLQGRSTP